MRLHTQPVGSKRTTRTWLITIGIWIIGICSLGIGWITFANEAILADNGQVPAERAQGGGVLPVPLTDQADPEAVGLAFIQRETAYMTEIEGLQNPTLLTSLSMQDDERLVLATATNAEGNPRLFIMRLVQQTKSMWEVRDAANVCVPNQPYAVSYRTSQHAWLLGLGITQTTQLSVAEQTVTLPTADPVSLVRLQTANEEAEVFPIGDASEQSYAACLAGKDQ